MNTINILNEEINNKEVTYAFWVDEQGNLLMDINDKEELRDYINRKAEKLNGDYKSQLNGSDIRKISIPEIINRISWFYVKLFGVKKNFSLYNLKNKQINHKPEKEDVEGTIYTKMHIRTDLTIDPKRTLKNKIIDRTIESIKKIYPSIERVKVFGANDNSTEYYL